MEITQFQQKDRRSDALGDLRVLPDELICAILESLNPIDAARLSCVSSVMNIFCNEEPLWMTLCLKNGGRLEYKSSWKDTTLYQRNVSNAYAESCRKHLHFDGFYSLFLHRRWYRCFTVLDKFCMDRGDLERKNYLTLEEFRRDYDGRKPVLLTGLTETWPARSTWTIDQLLCKYGDTLFRISQRSSKKITMRFKDYVSYMNIQHDEDPLYIFDDKFGETAPNLLKGYSVPHLFQEDFFDVLDGDQRPPFRWLIIGPERSGASWHVDPALTSAWNTLLCGRKRWALYPPGKVPLGVTVHVNEEDGDVNVETPSSLQWWLDFYPLLGDHDKPIELTQHPGETIFVPSGWWHCVLNLETTIAVTQNFVNTSNFEFVCLDMAPGHYHKGVSRAGLLAIHDNSFGEEKKGLCTEVNNLNYSNMTRKEKRPRLTEVEETCNGVEQSNSGQSPDFFYDISFLSKFLDEERDHYNSMWSASNCIGQREMRQWLHKLWVRKPAMRDLIWKGADLALNVEKWSARMTEICAFHNLPSPFDDERLPVGTGSNPVYLVGDHVMKIYVEGGLEAAIHCLGTELEFYSRISEVESPLRDHIPDIVASGILFHENGCYKIVSWDGKGVPNVIAKSNLGFGQSMADGFTSFGVWSKSQFDLRKAGNLLPADNPPSSTANAMIWPYIITKRCKGDIFAYLRDDLSREDVLNLASFLGDQLRNLHLLPLPSLYPLDYPISLDASIKTISDIISISAEWEPFMQTMIRRRKDVLTRLTQCRGDPIPKILIEKVEEYIPSDPAMLLDILKDENGLYKVCSSPTWIHSDVMDDNIHMEACCASDCIIEYDMGASTIANGARNGSTGDGKQQRWLPCHILDFSDMTIGEPIFDLIPIYLDIFRGDSVLLEQFLKSYKLPLARRQSHGDSLSYGSVENGKKFERISYRAMCYCILHDENVLGSIFSLWRELKTAKSWDEVEETAWGELNKYQGSY